MAARDESAGPVSIVLARAWRVPEDAKGNPILPIFKLAASNVAHVVGEAPVFAKNGPIWKAEVTKPGK